MTRITAARHGAAVALFSSSLIAGIGFAAAPAAGVAQQAGAPQTAAPCGSVTTGGPMAAPTVTPASGTMDAEFDQMFIDMMIPHHASIAAAAVAASTRIQDPELRSVATDTILDQAVEIGELRDLRERLYGDSLPMPIDEQTLAMMPNMPGMAGLDPAGMAVQLDPAAMAQQMCQAENVELTFIDVTIAHHQAAIVMAQAALDQSTNEAIREIARHDLSVQQSQIEELQRIRTEITGSATPEAGA